MKKEKHKHKHRLSIANLMTLFVFVIYLMASAISFIVVYILQANGIIAHPSDGLDDNYLMFYMAVVSLIVGVLLLATIGKISLKPINRIIDKLNQLASGDFKARLSFGKPIRSHPVFIEVSDSFNRLAEELEDTEMLRNDFINNFSHEFKTPIVSIAGFAKLLKRGNLTEEQKAEYINIIDEESMRLSAMATNVLNLTKFENQTILTDVTEFNLSEQLRNSIIALEGKWVKKKIDFNLDLGEHIISGNKDMLKHVWLNLIDNAVKFSPDGGTVEIGVREQDNTYAVSILNYGIEITPEQQKKIFKKFYQADESHASEGNGIGLALVKRVTELHNGKVSVYCENSTTKFTVKLPKTH